MTHRPEPDIPAAATEDPAVDGQAVLPGLRYSFDRAILGPPLFLAVMVIILAGAASLSVPIERVNGPLEALLAAVGLGLIWRARRPRTIRLLLLLAAAAGVTVWLALAVSSGHGLPVPSDLLSLRPDTWSYEAFSDYLRRFPRGQIEGMPMVDEFGSHLRGSRFASSALLAFIQGVPLLGDVGAAHLVLVGGCVATHFFAMLALGRALNRRANWSMPLLGAFLATAAGWLSDVIDLSNNDNLIFAALSPAWLALLCPRPSGFFSSRWAVTAGMLVFAAMLYNYPEGTALLGALALPLAVAIFWPVRRGGLITARHRYEVVAIGLLGALLALPYIPIFVSFLHTQMALGLDAKSVRPYEGVFPGLLSNHWLPASFALGEEQQQSSYQLIDNLVPFCLCVLVALGAWAIGRTQRWFPWVALPFLALWSWQNLSKHYDYGTYKVLALASWWVYPAISAGWLSLGERFAWRWSWRAGALALFLLGVGTEKYRHRVAPPPELRDRMRALTELSSLHFVTGQGTVLLSLDDDMDHLWASYYLRKLPLATWKQRSYLAMPHIAPYLARGVNPPPETAGYVLVSGQRPDALWQNSRFALVRNAPLYIAGIENPVNGIETAANERFLWIGTQPTTFRIVTQQGGAYRLNASRFGVGPSMGDRATVSVEVTDAQGVHTVAVDAATGGVPITLAPGPNAIRLRCLDLPEPGPHKGDSRELMLGVQGPKVAPVSVDPQ